MLLTKRHTEKEAAAPERTCVGCGQRRPKWSLHRLVIDQEGQLVFDKPQTAPGRGAYLCGKGCLTAAAKRRAFQRAFRGKAKPLETTGLEALLQAAP
ncbi:MAG: YlxR family protein [Myxococcota bacterium]